MTSTHSQNTASRGQQRAGRLLPLFRALRLEFTGAVAGQDGGARPAGMKAAQSSLLELPRRFGVGGFFVWAG
jgi:hypothetical protein